MTISWETLGVLFMSLFTLYSPLSNVGAYATITGHLTRSDQKRIAWRVLRNIIVVMLVFVWAGEILFEVLGVSSDTLRVAGGVALMSAGLPMMLGTASPRADDGGRVGRPWTELVVVPLTFPMSLGGTTAAYLVTASALADDLVDLLAISGVVVLFALVVFATHWFSAPVANQLSPQGRDVLNRVGGIILVAISVDLVTGGLRGLLPGLAG